MANSRLSSNRCKACLAVIGGITLAVVAAVTICRHRSGAIAFDADKWKNAMGFELRQLMVDDLRQQHRLEGLDQQQVITILGPPDRRNRFGHEDFNYNMGPEKGFISIDSAWLTLDFVDGHVAGVRITHD
jgi:hypothetical protein